MTTTQLLRVFDEIAGDDEFGEVAKDHIRAFLLDEVGSWFEPPKTLGGNDCRHNGRYVVKSHSDNVFEVIRSGCYTGSIARIRTYGEKGTSITTLSKLSDDEIESLWEAINECGFTKDRSVAH